MLNQVNWKADDDDIQLLGRLRSWRMTKSWRMSAIHSFLLLSSCFFYHFVINVNNTTRSDHWATTIRQTDARRWDADDSTRIWRRQLISISQPQEEEEEEEENNFNCQFIADPFITINNQQTITLPTRSHYLNRGRICPFGCWMQTDVDDLLMPPEQTAWKGKKWLTRLKPCWDWLTQTMK